MPWIAISIAAIAATVGLAGWAVVAVGKGFETMQDPCQWPAHPGPDFTEKLVFISGPITGRENLNREAFRKAEDEIMARGAVCAYNPTRLADIDEGQPHEHYMAMTLHDLTRYVEGEPNLMIYDALVLLEGWQQSQGARIEKAVAEACGIEVYEWADCR